MIYFKKKWVDNMNGYKVIDGKNAVVKFNNEEIIVDYKSALGDLFHKDARFTFDDVDDIELKKPDVSSNGYLLFVLHNNDIHKIVLTKLDEVSLEVTDDLVKTIREKLGLTDDVKPVIIDTPFAIFGGIKKKDKEENMPTPVYVTEPRKKTKEELVKEEIRAELNARIKERRELIEQNKLKEEPVNVVVGTDKDNKKVNVEVTTIKPVEKTFIEGEKPVAVAPLKQSEQNMIEKHKHDVIIDELKRKLNEIENELITLQYEEKVLSKYTNDYTNLNNIEDWIKKIEDLINQLELIKQEILNKMDGRDYVPNMVLDVTGDNKVDVDDFKTIYLKTMDEITEYEKVLDTTKDNVEIKKDKVDLDEKEYDEQVRNLIEQENLRKQYEDMIAETRRYIDSYDKKVGTTFVEIEREKTMNLTKVRNDTKVLLGLSAASMLVPKSGPIKSALFMATGLAVIRDAFIPQKRVIRERYFEQVTFDTEINNSLRDINFANKAINDSRDDIRDIKNELEQKASSYPAYRALINDFDKLEVELDRQEKEIYEIRKTLDSELERNQVKVLRLEKDTSQY